MAERDGRVVGYLHYDCFASEPEMHRIYLDEQEIGRGTGSALMSELHARVGEETTYVVLVALDNETARRFYARHGLVEERRIPDGNVFYRDSMGVEFPPDAERCRRSYSAGCPKHRIPRSQLDGSIAPV